MRVESSSLSEPKYGRGSFGSPNRERNKVQLANPVAVREKTPTQA